MNPSEFTTIKISLEALSKIEDLIHELKSEANSAYTCADAGELGYSDHDNFGAFVENMTNHDPDFIRKLVNLGLCL